MRIHGITIRFISPDDNHKIWGGTDGTDSLRDNHEKFENADKRLL